MDEVNFVARVCNHSSDKMKDRQTNRRVKKNGWEERGRKKGRCNVEEREYRI